MGKLKERLSVIDADYTLIGNRAAIRLYCKDEKGKTVLVLDPNFSPYFYVMAKKGKENGLMKRIKELDEKKLEVKIIDVELAEKIWMGEKTKLIKVTIDNPRKIKDVRDAIKDWNDVEESYEYDISTYKRYLIDRQIEPTGWIEVEGKEIKIECQADKAIEANSVKAVGEEKEPKVNVLAFDTEWVEENGKTKLIMLSIASENFKKVLTTHEWKSKPSYVEVANGEKEIIERFLEIIKERDPDIICGYNSDGFDFPKLKDRATELKVSLRIGRDSRPMKVVRRGRISSAISRGRIHIDLFNFIDHILSASMKSEVLTLDEVSQELLGMEKKKMDYKEMVDIWKKKEQMDRLAEYSLHDSILTFKLAEFILPQIFALCRLTGQLPFDCSRYTYSQLVEAYYMRKAVVDNVLIPNRPKTDELERRRMEPVYKGAIVIEPKKGIHSNILVFDFRSLYPTIIVSHNISLETFNCKDSDCKKNNVPETNWCFCTKKRGFIPKNLETLIKERQKIKKKMESVKKDSDEYRRLNDMQYALKIIANASYGYFGFFGARWYKRECGSAVAAWGRYYITKVTEQAKKNNFEIIYGDTDSLMVRMTKELRQDELRKLGKKFAEEVNKQLPGMIELEFRDLYEGGIFVTRGKGEVGAKKRYALIDYKGKLEIRGFETVRRDWCDLSKRIQREVLTIILHDKNPNKAIQLVRDTVKKINDKKVSLDELTIFEQITRPLSAYEAIGPHVKAAQKAKTRGRPIGEGSVIGFIITKGSGKISDRAEPVEDVKPNQYDPEYYIGHQILPAAMRVLKALDYTEQEVLSGKTQKKLGAWFKK